jgi:lysylphosphatidylglycerol synthetase-like protein (DUF2156 family)
MLIAFILAVLALFDLMLAGFRSAAGREGKVVKDAYFRAAIARGAWFALAIVGAHIALVTLLVLTAPSRHATWHELVTSGTVATYVLGGFATLTLLALLLWLSPVVEHRLLASILVLGPLTLVRPFVIIGALVAACLVTTDPRVWIVGASAGICMLAMERALARRYAERWRRLVG